MFVKKLYIYHFRLILLLHMFRQFWSILTKYTPTGSSEIYTVLNKGHNVGPIFCLKAFFIVHN